MKDLLIITAIASTGLIFVREFGWRLKIKPFTCELCMAFWLTAFYYHNIEGIFYGFLAGAIATYLNKYI